MESDLGAFLSRPPNRAAANRSRRYGFSAQVKATTDAILAPIAVAGHAGRPRPIPNAPNRSSTPAIH